MPSLASLARAAEQLQQHNCIADIAPEGALAVRRSGQALPHAHQPASQHSLQLLHGVGGERRSRGRWQRQRSQLPLLGLWLHALGHALPVCTASCSHQHGGIPRRSGWLSSILSGGGCLAAASHACLRLHSCSSCCVAQLWHFQALDT